jgi:tripartite-type tricarboxylate transporter receptor subunit TctC
MSAERQAEAPALFETNEFWAKLYSYLASVISEEIMRIAAMVCGVLFLATPALVASAQEYPSRPIRIVAPVGPGGSPDILARLIGGKLHERWGQPVVVENRAGAGQMIGADLVAKAAADGYTLLLPTVTYTTSAATQSKLPFDPVSDLTGITMIGESAFLVTVHPSLPVKTIKDLIALAKARPGDLNYASAGTGSMLHLMTETMAAGARIKLVHVPYKSIAPAITETVGGHVPILLGSLTALLRQVKAGRLRALAVTTAKRSRFVPELPTVSEAGIPGFEARQWWGLFAPGKTPRSVVTKLNGEVHRILAADDVKSRLAHEGAEAVVTSPEAFGTFVKSEIAKWKKVAQELNIQTN